MDKSKNTKPKNIVNSKIKKKTSIKIPNNIGNNVSSSTKESFNKLP